MAVICRWLALIFIAASARGEPVQLADLRLPPSAAGHKQDVVNLFVESYEAYRKYAWGHDDLLPVNMSYADTRNGWGASIVESMGTMWLMGFYDWFEEAVDHIAKVDFAVSQTGDAVNVFETTIRYVGGLLSAYELSGYKYDILVQKAEQVTQQLAYAFVGNSSIPYNSINFTNHTPVYDITSIAAVGTLTMEWNRLSLYSRNDTYRQLAERPVQYMIHMPTLLTGMPSVLINPFSGNSVGSYVTWGGGSDSYFEYLIKYARLTNTDDNSYADAWLTAVDTSIKELLKTSTVGNWVYLADYGDQHEILHVGSHLACFHGGNWIMGGKLTNNDTIFDIGLQLTDACWNTYASTTTGIGPETFIYSPSDDYYLGGPPPTPEQIRFYNEHGFYANVSHYWLRPEVLESNFYSWRATGDTKYLDNAASAIRSFQKHLSTTVAYAGISDINNVTSTRINGMESFWFAEVLKYLYLTFDDPSHISLNDYVFSTEAHPFKAPTAKSVYGSGPGPHPVSTRPFIPEPYPADEVRLILTSPNAMLDAVFIRSFTMYLVLAAAVITAVLRKIFVVVHYRRRANRRQSAVNSI